MTDPWDMTPAQRMQFREAQIEAKRRQMAPKTHVREATTAGEHLDPPQPGILLADCSCGVEYTVPQGGDEYAALEKAHAAHVARAQKA